MNATATTTTVPPVSPATRRANHLARRRDLEGGAVSIVPQTQGMILKADPFTPVGEGVRRAFHEAREDDGQVIRFQATAYHLRPSQVLNLADRLKLSQEAGVRHVGRAMVGEPIMTQALAGQQTPVQATAAPVAELVDLTIFDLIGQHSEAAPV